MALQGTVESFPVIEVVRLLADGGHTGRLTVDGDRGSAVMWVADGSLLGGELGNTHQLDPVRLVTEALRHRTGVFSFDVMPLGADVSAGMVAAPLSAVLVDAEARLAEWASIEQVIPTVAHRLRLSSALPVESVTLDRQQWALVVSAAHLPEVRESATELGMDELTACRLATRMVELGLLVVEEPTGGIPNVASMTVPSQTVPPQTGGSVDANLPFEVPVDDQGPLGAIPLLDLDGDVHVLDIAGTAALADDEFAGHFPIDDLIGSGPDDDWDDMAEPAPPVAPDPFVGSHPEPLVGSHTELRGLDEIAQSPFVAPVSAPAPASPMFAGLPDLDGTDLVEGGRARLGAGPVDEVELQRQMADLSPRAAEAIAAALESLPDGPAV